MAKKLKISPEDTATLADWVKDEHARRKNNKFRKEHEKVWAEVDRMIAMKAETSVVSGENPNEEGWESNIELGSLADASEIIAEDTMRIIFPSDREFFKPHMKIPPGEINPETGEAAINTDFQKMADGVYKSLMSQQHTDFGFRFRVKLSIKEALHHGSLVAIARWDTQRQFGSGKVKEIGAPVWVPHSMWNCFPDDSPSVIGTNVTYDGTMIIEDQVPIQTAIKQKWHNVEKIQQASTAEKKNHVDVLHLYGDAYIPRKSGKPLSMTNLHVIVANGLFALAENNETESSPVIYTGYERDDVRDPYYSSPLIKRAPTNKLATHCANKFIDAVDLRTFPPIGYDANEPTFKESGGPEIYPKATFPLRAGGQIKAVEVADPQWALQGMQVFKSETEEGTGVDVTRKGVSASTEQTAFEVSKMDQKSEVRTIGFVSTLENQGIKPFLYLQHDLNKKFLKPYGFFNTQIDTPDFLTLDKRDLLKYAKDGHFEVVGSKGVLGEERRRQGSLEVTSFFASNELFAGRLDQEEIMQDAYRDVGVKDPERYLNFNDEEDPRIAQITQQAEEAVQQLQGEIQQLQEQVQQDSLLKEQFAAEKAALNAKSTVLSSENKLLEEQIQLQAKADSREKQLFSAEKRLLILKDQVGDMMLKAENKGIELKSQGLDINSAEAQIDGKAGELKQLFEEIEADRAERADTKSKVVQFIKAKGSDDAKELVGEL